MKLTCFLLLMFCCSLPAIKAQVSPERLAPPKGPYAVGFTHFIATDSSRTYHRVSDWNNKRIMRPISVSMWYPSADVVAGKQPMRVLDYMQILKAEEEWEYLPDEQVLNWFSYANTPAHQAHLVATTQAYPSLRAMDSLFPAVVYAPGYGASSIENFALCEYLASYGYVVVACPSRGADSRPMEGATLNDVEAQARDIEFLVKEVMGRSGVAADKVATMGFSFGGLAGVLAQTRNSNIKAIVSLDGSIKYQYPTLKKASAYNIRKVNVPFIHMAQKAIPDAVLLEDKLDSTINTRFEFFDSLLYSDAYRLQFHHLTHSCFNTLGILFQDRDARQDKSEEEIMASYKWVALYSRQFLDGWLKGRLPALDFLKREPVDNGLPQEVLTASCKQPIKKAFTFEDFNEAAAAARYHTLLPLYQSIVQQYPGFQLNEGKLNNLGLQLLFAPGTAEEGIKVLLFATGLYPQSANLFDSLGEAYRYAGNREQAIACFTRSLALDPQNQNAKDRLLQLHK